MCRSFWYQAHDLHSRLPALEIPSDSVTVSDGVTPSCGHPIHVHVLFSEGRGGKLQFSVVGLQPVSARAGGPNCMDPDTLNMASALKFSSRTALVTHARMVEKQFGLQARFRWAGRVADGAEEGIAQMQAGEFGFPERQRELFGQIDQWHVSETAANHADQLSSLQGFAWKDQYLDIIRRLRAKYGFGVHKSLLVQANNP